MKVAILGGGVAGIVAARVLARGGVETHLYERNNRLGGLHHSPCFGGVAYDIGTFVFQRNHQLLRLFPELEAVMVKVPSRFASLTMRGSLDTYPLTLRGYIRDNGLFNLAYAAGDICVSKVLHWRRRNVPSFVKYYLGSSIYSRSGLKEYVQRLYDIPDREIDIEFAKKRLALIQRWGSIRKNLARVVKFKPSPLTSSPYLGKTDFVRPAEGFLEMYGLLQEAIDKDGAEVFLRTPLKKIRRNHDGFEIESDRGVETYDRVLSTIPLSALFHLLGLEQPEPFESRGLLTLCYKSASTLPRDATVLHNFTGSGDWKRITMFSSYYGSHDGRNYFSCEITVDGIDAIDVEQYRKRFEDHLRGLGLVTDLEFQGSMLTKDAYPVFRRTTFDKIQRQKARIRDLGIELVGRQGDFDYISSSDTAKRASRVAEDIVASKVPS